MILDSPLYFSGEAMVRIEGIRTLEISRSRKNMKGVLLLCLLGSQVMELYSGRGISLLTTSPRPPRSRVESPSMELLEIDVLPPGGKPVGLIIVL